MGKPLSRRAERARDEPFGLIHESGRTLKDRGFDPEEGTKFSVRQERGQLAVSLSGPEPPN